MTRNGLIATCFVCLLIAGTGRAHGVDPSRHITQYAHTAWRVQEGIFGGTPNAITQTPDGYLWIGTLDGSSALTVFDSFLGQRLKDGCPEFGDIFSSDRTRRKPVDWYRTGPRKMERWDSC